jgi:hypothetical protein
LKHYEQAYNSQDIDALSAIWPTWPESKKRATQNKFKETKSVNLTLQLDSDQPVIDSSGNTATARGKMLLKATKKDLSTIDDEYPFNIQLAHKGKHWVIVKGP